MPHRPIHPFPSCNRAEGPPRTPAPVRTEAEALHLLHLAATHPAEHETIAFFLDAAGIGGVITVVSGTAHPDALLAVTECLARAGAPLERAVALVVASVRPHHGVLPDDLCRWIDASNIADDHGIHLLEWFVLGPDGVATPRDLGGEPDRWHLVNNHPTPHA